MGRSEGGIKGGLSIDPVSVVLSADMDRREGGIKGGLSIDPVSVV